MYIILYILLGSVPAVGTELFIPTKYVFTLIIMG